MWDLSREEEKSNADEDGKGAKGLVSEALFRLDLNYKSKME